MANFKQRKDAANLHSHILLIKLLNSCNVWTNWSLLQTEMKWKLRVVYNIVIYNREDSQMWHRTNRDSVLCDKTPDDEPNRWNHKVSNLTTVDDKHCLVTEQCNHMSANIKWRLIYFMCLWRASQARVSVVWARPLFRIQLFFVEISSQKTCILI